MKTSYAALFLALSSAAAFAQKTGDTVTPEALGKIEWVRGEAPKAWEPGKVYVLECWATWCGPCVAAIPHVDALYDKYHEKGLNVIGVNVWEDGKDKVENFLKDKGDGMSYPVAYTGKGGAFETEWLKPGGVQGIPHAFIVKDGKVVMTTHPMQLTEETIEGLLAGGEQQEKVLATIKKKQEAQEKMGAVMQDFQKASRAKDIPGMEKALADLTELDADGPYVPVIKLEVAFAKEDWTAAQAVIEGMKDDSNKLMVLATASRNALKDTAPAGFRKVVANGLEKAMESNKQVTLMVSLARLQWSLDDKDAATITAKNTAEEAQKMAAKNPKFPLMPFEKFAEAVGKGEMPSEADFGTWMREAMPAAATPAVPATPMKPREDAKVGG